MLRMNKIHYAPVGIDEALSIYKYRQNMSELLCVEFSILRFTEVVEMHKSWQTLGDSHNNDTLGSSHIYSRAFGLCVWLQLSFRKMLAPIRIG